jgi:hypothetical protein
MKTSSYIRKAFFYYPAARRNSGIILKNIYLNSATKWTLRSLNKACSCHTL